MELFDRHTRRGRRLDHVTDEPLVLEHACQPVLRPQFGGQSAAVGPDENELDFVADERLEAGRGESFLDAAQRAAAAERIR